MERFFAHNMICATILVGILNSCDIKKNDIEPQSVFTRIYDNGQLEEAFYPLDLKQTPDGGFLILSDFVGDTVSYAWPKPYLMKTNNVGNLEWEVFIEAPHVSPVPDMIEQNGQFYFFCMDNVTLKAKVLSVNLSNGGITLENTYEDIEYPLYARRGYDERALVVSYDRSGRSSKLFRLSQAFSVEWSSSFNVIDDAGDLVISHLTRKGKQFPFFIGEIGDGQTADSYFVNTFQNFTLSLIFVNASNGNLTGLLNSFQYNGAVSSAVHLNENRFALSKFNFGDNYIMPNLELVTDGTLSIENYGNSKNQELTSDAKIRVQKLEIDAKKVIVYVSQTKTNQLVIYIYDEETGLLIDTKFLGSKDPIEIGNFVKTEEGGLAFVTQTYVVGRFPRIQLIKLSPEEFDF